MNNTERFAACMEELEGQRRNATALRAQLAETISVLAHDIRGPLTSIVGFAELLEEGFLAGDAARDAARTIRANAERLATLATDVGALAHADSGALEIRWERVDLADVVRRAIESNPRTINFVAPPQAPVLGDAERLRQAVASVVKNAIAYSPGGEPIDVTVACEGAAVSVTVWDRGIGIAQEDLPTIFERFTRGSNARRAKIPGSGIGLFVARAIVERHGGSLIVQTSAIDEGSTFVVTVPAFEADAACLPTLVTIASDDRDLAAYLGYELRAQGYRVRESRSMSELIESDLHSGDIVIADTGFATPQALRGAFERASIRIIGIGADLADGWDRALRRPFLISEVFAALQ
ncbi:MAG: HAMP domain-containing histidine kinase [Candidatus Eremiobacteraeota bacterium]|nr:HAMP domain-containing histidine kinase [Candidatus Eremiobacteraeota bacterium]